MDQTVAQLSSRLNKIEMEYTVAARKRKDGASKAFQAISSISEEDVEMLKTVVPNLVVVRSFTEQDLFDNTNDEVGQIRQVAEELRQYIERRLSFYEEQL